jgi:hypothetical protein
MKHISANLQRLPWGVGEQMVKGCNSTWATTLLLCALVNTLHRLLLLLFFWKNLLGSTGTDNSKCQTKRWLHLRKCLCSLTNSNSHTIYGSTKRLSFPSSCHEAIYGGRGRAALINLGTTLRWVVHFMLWLLYPQEEPFYLLDWAPQSVWTFWRWEKAVIPAGIWIPDYRAHSLVAIPAMKPQTPFIVLVSNNISCPTFH